MIQIRGLTGEGGGGRGGLCVSIVLSFMGSARLAVAVELAVGLAVELAVVVPGCCYVG